MSNGVDILFSVYARKLSTAAATVETHAGKHRCYFPRMIAIDVGYHITSNISTVLDFCMISLTLPIPEEY